MLIAVVIIAGTYFIDDTGISYIMSFKCILWVSQALTEAEREECRKVRGNAKYKGAVPQPFIRRSIYESHNRYELFGGQITEVQLFRS